MEVYREGGGSGPVIIRLQTPNEVEFTFHLINHQPLRLPYLKNYPSMSEEKLDSFQTKLWEMFNGFYPRKRGEGADQAMINREKV